MFFDVVLRYFMTLGVASGSLLTPCGCTGYLVPGITYLVLVFGNLFSERLFDFDSVSDLNICLYSVNGVQA